MESLTNNALFSSGLWERALESYARAVHLTVKLFDGDARVVFGPIHPTPLFQLFEATTGYEPGLFAECARRCLAQTNGRPAVMVSEFYGLSVVGTSLVLDGKIVGAAVGGYAFVDFSQLSEVQRLAQNSGISFERLWQVAREGKPIPQQRLVLNGELLQVLGDALLRENYRTRQYEQAVLTLQETVREKDQAHQELEQAAMALRRLNDDLNHFAFAASHDLQEPLRMVTTYSQLLVKRCGNQLGEESSLCVGFIEEGTGRMRRLLADLLAYIQIAARGKELDESVDLNKVLETATRNLNAAIEESGATVSSDSLPVVWGQPVHFVQLFQNLISNAIKYRAASPPRVQVSAERLHGEWRFAVADNGMGIDTEYHQVIFGVFKRLHGPAIPGTGIGLAICQRVVERYRGRIWVESQPQDGAIFYFTLPVAEEKADERCPPGLTNFAF
jgi:signal transduction histidine kinase